MPHKYLQAAAIVRAQVIDGTLKPGQPAPSAARLARLTGFSVLTCRKGLRVLVTEGVLTPGPSPAARPRVTAGTGPDAGDAAGALSRALAARRRANGLTQPGLSDLTGYSVTTIGHAETSRLWQSREFWEKADLALAAGGELTRLHDAYRAGGADPVGEPGNRGRLPPGRTPRRRPCSPALPCTGRTEPSPPSTRPVPPGPFIAPKGASPSDQRHRPRQPGRRRHRVPGSASARKTLETGRAGAHCPSPASTSAGCAPTPPSTPSGSSCCPRPRVRG